MAPEPNKAPTAEELEQSTAGTEPEATPGPEEPSKEELAAAAEEANDTLNELAAKLEKQFGEEAAADMMRALGKGILNNFQPEGKPNIGVIGFSMGPDGIKRVDPEEMPPCVRSMIEEVTGGKLDVNDEVADDEDKAADSDESDVNVPEFISYIMSKALENLQNRPTPEALLEARVGEVQPDLRYFEKYMKSWVRKYVDKELSYFSKGVRKVMKKASKRDWKDTLKLVEGTNRKVRSDLGNTINNAVKAEMQRHIHIEHKPEPLQDQINKAQQQIEKFQLDAKRTGFKLMNEPDED